MDGIKKTARHFFVLNRMLPNDAGGAVSLAVLVLIGRFSKVLEIDFGYVLGLLATEE